MGRGADPFLLRFAGGDDGGGEASHNSGESSLLGKCPSAGNRKSVVVFAMGDVGDVRSRCRRASAAPVSEREQYQVRVDPSPYKPWPFLTIFLLPDPVGVGVGPGCVCAVVLEVVTVRQP